MSASTGYQSAVALWEMKELTKYTLDHDIHPLGSLPYADLKPLINSYIHEVVQIMWGVAVHGRDLYLLQPTLGPPKQASQWSGIN